MKLTCREIRLMSLRAVKIVIGDSMRDSIVKVKRFDCLLVEIMMGTAFGDIYIAVLGKYLLNLRIQTQSRHEKLQF